MLMVNRSGNIKVIIKSCVYNKAKDTKNYKHEISICFSKSLGSLRPTHKTSSIIVSLVIAIDTIKDGAHLTLPPHIFSVQVKSGVCYITGQWVASSQ